MVSSCNLESGEAWIYAEFKEKIRMVQFKNYLENQMKATQVEFGTFSADQAGQASTYDDECAKALFSVIDYSKKTGWTLVELGTPSVEPKAPAQTSTAEFLAQEREDLIIQEKVMRADPEAFQHDGGYAGPILGKQKMAERAESPTSAAGEPKRQRGSVLAMLHAELGILVVREEEVEKLKMKDASNAEEIRKLQDRDASNAEQTQKMEEKIDMLESKIDTLENKLANVNDTLPAKINELSADKTALQSKVNALETSVGDISAANDTLQVKYNDLGTMFLEISTERDDLQINNYTLQSKVDTAEMAVVKITAEKDELLTKYSRLERKIYDRERKISDMEIKLTAQTQESKRIHDLMRGIFNELPIRTVGFSNHPDDPGSDVVLIREPNLKRSSWVFRFKITDGENAMSTDALNTALAEKSPKHNKLVTIGDAMYGFVQLKACLASWILTEIRTNFDTVNHLELVSPTSRDAVLFEGDHSPKQWTEAMFNRLVSRIHRSSVAEPRASAARS